MQSKSFEKKVNKGKPAITSDTILFDIFPFTIRFVCIMCMRKRGRNGYSCIVVVIADLYGGQSNGLSWDPLKMKTLIVEDNVNYRRVLKDTLQTLFPSMVIHEATEGNEALERVVYVPAGTGLHGYPASGENGLQLTERIKTRYPDTKVVILTSYDSLEYREAAIRCGANCFISKDSMNWQQIETLVKSFDKVDNPSPLSPDGIPASSPAVHLPYPATKSL